MIVCSIKNSVPVTPIACLVVIFESFFEIINCFFKYKKICKNSKKKVKLSIHLYFSKSYLLF